LNYIYNNNYYYCRWWL